MKTTTKTSYHATIDGGQGGACDLQATSPEDALEQAMAWAKEGDWPDECPVDPCEQSVLVAVDLDGVEVALDSFCPWEV